MQSGSIFGLYGLTAIAALVCAAPATLGNGETKAERLGPVVGAALVLLAMTGYGAWRLATPVPAVVAGVKLRIVQPNLAQDAKFESARGPEILRKYLELSDSATGAEAGPMGAATHIIWPESAFPFLLHREAVALGMIADALPRGSILVTGAARSTGEGRNTRFYNSIQAVGDTGAVVASYDKVHLVPFGEYVPELLEHTLRALGIREFVAIPGGFTAGGRHTAFAVPGLPAVAGSVCYEAIFPGETMPPGPRPGLILNVTNDGWFGDTPGPRQHFAQARLRAVERGIPLVRAANTGISAVVDPYGRVTASLAVGREGIIDADLPAVTPVTVFDKIGTAILIGLCSAFFLVSLAGMRRHTR